MAKKTPMTQDELKKLFEDTARCSITMSSNGKYPFLVANMALRIGYKVRRKVHCTCYYDYDKTRKEIVKVSRSSFGPNDARVETATFNTDDVFAADWEIFEGVENYE